LTPGSIPCCPAYKARFGKDFKEWQLITYHRHLSAWSREQEQKVWSHEKLATLKYYAYKWMKKAMIRLGDCRTQDLHDLRRMLAALP
jgi:hypothetical protein